MAELKNDQEQEELVQKVESATNENKLISGNVHSEYGPDGLSLTTAQLAADISPTNKNLYQYQNIADSSSKVSQLKHFQNIAILNPVQLAGKDPEDEGRFSKLPMSDKIALERNEGTVKTNEGATEAVRRGQKEQLPHPKEILGEDAYNSHLAKFEGGATRFETPFIAEKSKTEWGFGRDFKFLTTKGEADKVQQESLKVDNGDIDGGPGIWHMEKEFGAPAGRWVDKNLGGDQDNPKNAMVRYDFSDPKKFNLDMASGKEIDAFKDEWKSGGQTLGGMNEAKIDKIDREEFLDELASSTGSIKENEIKFPETVKKNKKNL